eukprot:gene9361-12611_t
MKDINLNNQHIIDQSTAWCALNGLLYGKANSTSSAFECAPISLFPNQFPKVAFDYACSVQTTINRLIDKIARDRDFINNQLLSASKSDEFIKKLLEIYNNIPEKTIKNDIQCGILRSDYMVNYDAKPLQVEVNTIASSFGSLSQKVSEFQRFLLKRNENSEYIKNILQVLDFPSRILPNEVSNRIVQNPSLDVISSVLHQAHLSFNDEKSTILFIVQPGERNIADQRLLEAKLWDKYQIPVSFMTMAEIQRNCVLDSNNRLVTQNQVPVSVAYYRAGYIPKDYPSSKEWEARIMIEKSSAIKCPNIGYQLAGTKVIQAALCQPGVLEKYLIKEESDLLRLAFAKQFDLGLLFIDKQNNPLLYEEIISAVNDAIMEKGKNWVLKPQREGGGNNYYGEDLSKFLVENRNDSILSGFVLMQRIFPTPSKSAFFRQGSINIYSTINELGVYGTYLGSPDNEIVNEKGGYLLRTKQEGVDEGGVATGYSVLNAIILS